MSNHSDAVLSSWPIAELERIKRRCSDSKDTLKFSSLFIDRLRNRGYKRLRNRDLTSCPNPDPIMDPNLNLSNPTHSLNHPILNPIGICSTSRITSSQLPAPAIKSPKVFRFIVDNLNCYPHACWKEALRLPADLRNLRFFNADYKDKIQLVIKNDPNIIRRVSSSRFKPLTTPLVER